MLPGYNHNIRYKDKVFHVQTEDNGLDDPDLVTQVFLGGQIVAIERSSYSEILFEGLDERGRDERIKQRMQDQHKRLLRNLVQGMYDARVDVFLRAAEGGGAAAPEVSRYEAAASAARVEDSGEKAAQSDLSEAAPPSLSGAAAPKSSGAGAAKGTGVLDTLPQRSAGAQDGAARERPIAPAVVPSRSTSVSDAASPKSASASGGAARASDPPPPHAKPAPLRSTNPPGSLIPPSMVAPAAAPKPADAPTARSRNASPPEALSADLPLPKSSARFLPPGVPPPALRALASMHTAGPAGDSRANVPLPPPDAPPAPRASATQPPRPSGLPQPVQRGSRAVEAGPATDASRSRPLPRPLPPSSRAAPAASGATQPLPPSESKTEREMRAPAGPQPPAPLRQLPRSTSPGEGKPPLLVEDDEGSLITAESLLSPDAVLEIEDLLSAQTLYDPRPPVRQGRREERVYTDEDLLSVIEKELSQQLPWSPGPQPQPQPQPQQPQPQLQQQPRPLPAAHAPDPRPIHDPRTARYRAAQAPSARPDPGRDPRKDMLPADRPRTNEILHEPETVMEMDRRPPVSRPSVPPIVAPSFPGPREAPARPSIPPRGRSLPPAFPNTPPPIGSQPAIPAARTIRDTAPSFPAIIAPHAHGGGRQAPQAVGPAPPPARPPLEMPATPPVQGEDARGSIFVIERSLDEAILSYLSEDAADD